MKSNERRPVLDPARAHEYFTKKIEYSTGPVELQHMLEDGEEVVVVDVRAEEDYRQGHVPGSINLPQERWSAPQGLAKDKLNVLYCYSQQCHLAAKAAVEFARAGYPVMEMDGGFEAWEDHGLAEEREHDEDEAGEVSHP